MARIEQWKTDQQKLQIEAQEENLRQKKIADERRQAQELKERQARAKAEAEAKLEEAKAQAERLAQEKRHKEELLRQAEERQARAKAEAEAKLEKAKAQAERLAQEKRQQEELLRQQAQEREEKNKQEKIIREENQPKEFELKEGRAQLEARREAIRKQLEDGIEAMYQEALSLYKRGDYTAAADKFKDVQDIIPGYKRSEQYMDEARQKSLAVPAPPSASRQNDVSKALDLVDFRR